MWGFSPLNRFLFRPPNPPDYTSKHFDGNLVTVEGLACLLFPKRHSRYFVIYFHGNATDLGGAFIFTEMISKVLKVTVLCIDYPGYGLSPGYSTEETVNEAAEKVYNFVHKIARVPTERIILFGTSIGTGICIDLAEKLERKNEKVALLVLVSAFTSINSVVKHKAGNFLSKMFSEQFNSVEKIGGIHSRILIFHGIEDKLIPYTQAIDLAENSNNSTLFLKEGMTHNEGYDLREDILDKINYSFNMKGPDPFNINYALFKNEFYHSESSSDSNESFLSKYSDLPED